MALRNQIKEDAATFPDPVKGVNLRASEEDLTPGEARLMQNCVFDSGTKIRNGSTRLNSSTLGAYKILGGHKYYYGGASPTSKRLIAFNNRISVLSDAGSETNLTTSMTASKDTHFLTWPITDKAYICNGTDELCEYDGTTFQTVSTVVGSSQVPGNSTHPPLRMMAPILDRMMGITVNGIERTNARVGHVWSKNSSWATLRPVTPGLFTGITSFTIRGQDAIYPGIIALQASAYHLITGTMFGTDVTAGSASNDDASIRLLDSNVGTSSPYSIVSIPGLGLFWFTTDLNVYWLPEGSLVGHYIGHKLQSTNATAGIESTNRTQLGQVWMRYLYPYLMLGIPTGSNAYADTQFWLDVRSMKDHPDAGPVWYGPMTGQTISRCWDETLNGDRAIMGGEGLSTNGAFVYNLRAASTYTDAVGASNVNVSMLYRTVYPSFGYPSRKKYVQGVNADIYVPSGTPTCALYDLDGIVAAATNFEAL